MNPNAFMNDEAWLVIFPKPCKSIRRREIIRDHSDWWFLLYLDEFTSHVNLLNAHEIFVELKIMFIKEEGDTSHVCQAYDQQAAKDDKTHMRAALNMLNPVISQSMDQWYLIDIAINARNCIKKESWIDSFKKVNMHPHTRSNFCVCIRKLNNCGFLSAEKFFEKRTTTYDAMPACWKKLDVEHRQAVMRIICNAYNYTPLNQNVWRKQNIFSLSIVVRLEDVFKLRTCYLNEKLYPSLFLRLE